MNCRWNVKKFQGDQFVKEFPIKCQCTLKVVYLTHQFHFKVIYNNFWLDLLKKNKIKRNIQNKYWVLLILFLRHDHLLSRFPQHELFTNDVMHWREGERIPSRNRPNIFDISFNAMPGVGMEVRWWFNLENFILPFLP